MYSHQRQPTPNQNQAFSSISCRRVLIRTGSVKSAVFYYILHTEIGADMNLRLIWVPLLLPVFFWLDTGPSETPNQQGIVGTEI